MPGTKPTKSESWAWFRAELVRRLGPDAAAALWEELRVRRVAERVAEQKKRAAGEIAYLEKKLREKEAEGRPTKRLEQAIVRRRALLEDD